MDKLNQSKTSNKLDVIDEIKADKSENKITVTTITNKYATDTDINKQINNNGETEDESAEQSSNANEATDTTPLNNTDDKPLNKKQIKRNKKAMKDEKKKQRKTPVKPEKKHQTEKVTPRTFKEQGQKMERNDEYISSTDTTSQSTPQIPCGQICQNIEIKHSEKTTIEKEKETKVKKWDVKIFLWTAR